MFVATLLHSDIFFAFIRYYQSRSYIAKTRRDNFRHHIFTNQMSECLNIWFVLTPVILESRVST
jgi:hypothetical protein